MDEEIDTENNVQFKRVQIKSEPSIYKMSTVGISTGTVSCERYPDNQANDGSGDYKYDIESQETAETFQNVDIQIKDEPNAYDTCGHYSWKVNETRDQSSDNQSGNSGDYELHMRKEPSGLELYGSKYAVCIKYEPNPCEVNESLTKSGSSVNFGKPKDQKNYKFNDCTPCSRNCYEKCSHASDDVFNGGVQVSSGPIKCEKNEYNIQKESTKQNIHSYNREHGYDDDNPSNRTCYEKSHNSDYNVYIAKSTHVEKKQYTSDICNFSSIYSSNLAAHKQIHKGAKSYSCDVCCYSTYKSSDLVRHKRKHAGEKPYKCDVCSYNAVDRDKLARHKIKHNGEKPYKCDICSYSAKSYDTLNQHKRKHTGEKPYKCDVCSYSAAWSGNLVMHKRQHTGVKPYKCNACSYSTYRCHDLARHKRKHTGEKPYKCDVCSYSTVDRSKLERHKIKHAGEKPYTCDVCSYSTAWSGYLAMHKRKHTGKKPYKCDMCSYASSRPSGLTIHQRKHTGEKPYKCGICSYSATSSSTLSKHIKRKHTGD